MVTGQHFGVTKKISHEVQRRIYEQIAGQRKPEDLTLKYSQWVGSVGGLSKLRFLHVHDTAYRIGVPELGWMQKHWHSDYDEEEESFISPHLPGINPHDIFGDLVKKMHNHGL
ncbi:hypothetical protein MVEG_04498 [Podila verticillata NRRL 6337]|nr:hypothetical protein MVEG_04498 [Podila verticillata NRRL 6337]